ncbi:hypothetical protein BCM02_103387 [Paenibacillus methanolicus]|uniref:Uncharacterized protein n=1 Tax=Paenibacillus methanolicus TaxID=582686 RepID=A0A5S5CFE6_9BACL|nr:hypothetical protein BCM02_103387 [Paenibacillus methanolicus]
MEPVSESLWGTVRCSTADGYDDKSQDQGKPSIDKAKRLSPSFSGALRSEEMQDDLYA